MKSRTRLILSTLAICAVASAAAPSAGAAARDVRTTRDMYGDRYCEYLVAKGRLPKLVATVWNTYGLNSCPQRLWQASDVTKLKARFKALAVVLNGPRYWLMDRASIALDHRTPEIGQVRSFGGLRMRAIATLDVPINNGRPGNVPYREVTVNRRNTFVWSHRHPVHELVAPGGRVYVMQAYSQIVDHKLRLADLNRLGPRLELPAGWRYRTRRLRRDLRLTTTRAKIIQDVLQNTYQRER